MSAAFATDDAAARVTVVRPVRRQSLGVPFGLRVQWTLAALLAAGYTGVVMLLSPLPLQDLPTHLARAVVMSDLLFHDGSRFGELYQFHLLLIPYLLGDLVLTGLVELLGPTLASAVWSAFVVLSLPCAVLFYVSITGIAAQRRALLTLVSLYLATDWFFTLGFMNFRLAVAMTVATLGLAEALRRRWSHTLFGVYVAAVLLDYLMHLSTMALLPVALIASALWRLHSGSMRLRAEALLLAPLAAVLVWNFAVADRYRAPSDLVENPYVWGSAYDKLAMLGSEFFRYRKRADELLLGLLAACLVLQIGCISQARVHRSRRTEFAALALAFVALYVILPRGYSDAWYVDVRALPLASLFAILACVSLPDSVPVSALRMNLAMLLAAALALANLTGLALVFVSLRGDLARFRSIVAVIPMHARVLPVFTFGASRNVVPLLHAASFVTIDRAGLIPYEFAGDNGNTDRYFRYVPNLHYPSEFWYGEKDVPRWNEIACDYEYLLVTQPFEAQRLQLPTRTIASNDIAVLLRIDKHACPAAITWRPDSL